MSSSISTIRVFTGFTPYIDLQVIEDIFQSKNTSYKDYVETMRESFVKLFMYRYKTFQAMDRESKINPPITNSGICSLMYPLLNPKAKYSIITVKDPLKPLAIRPDLSIDPNFAIYFLPVFAVFSGQLEYSQYYKAIRDIQQNQPLTNSVSLSLPYDFYVSQRVILNNYKQTMSSNQFLNAFLSITPLTFLNSSNVYPAQKTQLTFSLLIAADTELSTFEYSFSDPPLLFAGLQATQRFISNTYNWMINVLTVNDEGSTSGTFVEFEGLIDNSVEAIVMYTRACIKLDQSLTVNSIVNQMESATEPKLLNPVSTIYNNYLICKAMYNSTPAMASYNVSLMYTKTPNTVQYFNVKKDSTVDLMPGVYDSEFDPQQYDILPASDFSDNVIAFLEAYLYTKPKAELFTTEGGSSYLHTQFIEINHFWYILATMNGNFTETIAGHNVNKIQKGFFELYKLNTIESSTKLGWPVAFFYVYLNCLYIDNEQFTPGTNKYYVIPGLHLVKDMHLLYRGRSGFLNRNWKLPLSIDGLCVKPFFGFTNFNQCFMYLSKKLSATIKRNYRTDSQVNAFGDLISSYARSILERTPHPSQPSKLAKWYDRLNTYTENKYISYLVLISQFYIFQYLSEILLLNNTGFKIPDSVTSNKVYKTFQYAKLGWFFYSYAVNLTFREQGFTLSAYTNETAGAFPEEFRATPLSQLDYKQLFQFDPVQNLFFDSPGESVRSTYAQINGEGSSSQKLSQYDRLVSRYTLDMLIMFVRVTMVIRHKKLENKP